MMNLADTVTVTISVTGAEMLALKQLAIVSGALMDSLRDHHSKTAQKILTRVLLEHIHQIEVKAGHV